MLIVLAAAIIAALVQTFFMSIDCDVSWLITVNEKMLAGQRLYVDVIEVNPPASIWLYTPAVALAQLLRLRPEAVIVATFIASALVSCAVSLRISARLRSPPDAVIFAALVALVELLLPLGNFAQREHAALLLAIPVLAGTAVLADRRTLPLAWRVAIGAAAGLVIAIKPHFALAMLPATGWAAWRARSARPLVPIATAAAAVVSTYAVALIVFAPRYLGLMPMLADVYLPLHEQWLTLIRGPVVIVPLAIYALVYVLRQRRLETLPAMLLIGSVGFAAAGLLQAKGYLNHALPAMALGFVGLGLAATGAGVEASRRRLVLACAAALVCFELYAMASIRPVAGLAAAVARVAPPQPSIVTLGPDLSTGHPLVRNIGGRWAGSSAGLYAAVGAHQRLPDASGPEKARLLAWYNSDLDAFAADVRRERPDVILIDTRPQLAWLRTDSRIQGAIAAYRPRARVADVEVWVRQ